MGIIFLKMSPYLKANEGCAIISRALNKNLKFILKNKRKSDKNKIRYLFGHI